MFGQDVSPDRVRACASRIGGHRTEVTSRQRRARSDNVKGTARAVRSKAGTGSAARASDDDGIPLMAMSVPMTNRHFPETNSGDAPQPSRDPPRRSFDRN